MKWNILSKIKDSNQIVDTLLENRGLKTKKEIEEFLNPPNPLTLDALRLGINSRDLGKALKRIKLAIKSGEPIVVYGDYDADGICATAIVWETLRDLGAKALPFIPLREKEGYGISKEGIDEILSDMKYGFNYNINASIQRSRKTGRRLNGLLITVDSGIVAHEAVEYAKKKGIDVIIIDHHEKPKKLPKAFATIHTLQLCAAGIAFVIAKELNASRFPLDAGLELAAIATVTDLVPLVGPNRSIVKYGLEALNKTSRPGLKALLSVAGIEKVGTYEIGYMIGPRINASGRIENALTALRLLCTKDSTKARELATQLNETNRDRQAMLEKQTIHALEIQDSRFKIQENEEKILIIEHESYHQGVIGLIAGKLVEKYYLPTIVIAKGETMSKGSARSISGFNIIEAIRQADELLVNAGGHPMAAGFTIETSKIAEFTRRLKKYSAKEILPEMLERSLRIDRHLDLDMISLDLYQQIQQFSPFGIGNPEPVFSSSGVIQNLRTVGADGKHLKLVVNGFDAIAFNQGFLAAKLQVGDQIDMAFNLDLNVFNGTETLQLKVKDIKPTADQP